MSTQMSGETGSTGLVVAAEVRVWSQAVAVDLWLPAT